MNTIENPDGRQEFIINLEIDAPREKVFKAWSEAEQLKKWWGPKGFSLEVPQLDFTPGGKFHYCMQASDGTKMWGRFVYRKIEPSHKIEFINSFSDAGGGITRAPFSETWPEEMFNELTLTENAGKTLLTLRGYPINATPEENQTYHSNHESMRQGFGGTFDQLKSFLAAS